jgi:hypothetical protein
MSDGDDEIARIEDMIAGRRQPELRIEAAAGRLAQLYLQARDRPERFPAAYNVTQWALGRLKSSDPLYPKVLHVQAMALRVGGHTALSVEDAWRRAAAQDRDAWLLSLDPAPQEALGTACEWGGQAWAAERWSEAADAYEGADIALNRVILKETSGLDNRLQLLAAHSDHAPRAAFAAVKAGDVKNAVVMLERAAALLSASGDQTRELRDLAGAGYPQLRDQVLATLQAVATTPATRDSFGRQSPERLAALTANNAAVQQVRALDGFSRFAMMSNWQDVEQAAHRTALAYMAATDKGTVILVVRKGATEVAYDCVQATLADLDVARPFLEREFGDDPADSRDALEDLLGWLGENLMFSVFQCLGGDQPVTLLPFGTLALFPLNAGFVMKPATADHPAIPHVLFHPTNVSYAYSARTLNRAARSPAHQGSAALVVNNPVPLPWWLDPLLLSDFERDAVAAHFKVHELAGRDAVTDAVLDGIKDADIVHFSCHGIADATRHYTGVLVLAQLQTLTVEQFAQSGDLTARLVVLSACRSGAAALGPAAVTSLPAMLVAAGADAALATFWPCDEMATLLIVSRFYQCWQGGERLSAAVAFGEALEWLILSTAGELRAACPPAALDTPAGQELAQAAPDVRLYNRPYYWAAFFLVGNA